MRQAAIFLILAVASMAGSFLKSVIGSLNWPALTGIAITLFSGFFIFTVMAAQSQSRWKPSIQLTPAQKEHLNNVVQLMCVLILFAATAVTLVAIAEGGLGEIPNVLKVILN